jgi:hypothetical protein
LPLSSYSWPTSITPKVTPNVIADTLAAYDRLGKIIGGWGFRGPVVAPNDASTAVKAVADYACDGTADEVELQAAINASPVGGSVYLLPGTFNVAAPVVRKPNRAYVGIGGGINASVIIKVANGSSANFQAAGGVSGVLVPESWDTNATAATGPVTIMGLAVNGNRANNATGQHCGFLLGHGEYWSHYENLYAYECKLDGFRFPVLGKNGSSLMAGGVSDIRCRDFLATANTGHGLYAQKSSGVMVTDVVLSGNHLYFTNDGSGMYVDEAAGWRLVGNHHFWQNGKHALKFQDGSYACAIAHVYVEDIGRLGTSGEFLSGIEIKTFNGRSPTLHDCTVSVNVPNAGVNHRGIVVTANDTDAHAWVHDNEVRAEGTATSAMYGFVYDNGSGGSKLTLHEHANHAYGFVAGQDKGYFGTATYAFDPPRVLSATATWDPASIADGAAATTTLTVTGAAVGDPAVAALSTLTAAGSITITARVTAANTVSVTIRNNSGGAVDPASGTLRATVWKH